MSVARHGSILGVSFLDQGMSCSTNIWCVVAS